MKKPFHTVKRMVIVLIGLTKASKNIRAQPRCARGSFESQFSELPKGC